MAVSYAFPTDPMMGPSSPIDRISAKNTTFDPRNRTVADVMSPVKAAAPFDSLLQNLANLTQTVEQMPAGARNLVSKGARYAPGVMAGVQQFPTDPLAGAATIGLTALGGKGIQNLTAGISNPLARGAVQLAGGLLAAPIASQLGKGVSFLGGQLVGGAQAAVGDVANTVAGAQRESGQGAGTGSEPGTVSDKALAQRLQLAREMGVNLPGEYLTNNYQILQKYKESDKTRQMQLNQQTAQLQGQLNQQIIAGQLAAGAQQGAYATTQGILANNPYRDSILQTGGTRGI